MHERRPSKTESAAAAAAAPSVRVAVFGHVDHGKSTVIGRLAYDLGLIAEGRREAIAAMCRRRNMPFEWAFLLDAFQAERDQAVTIDATELPLALDGRRIVLVDAPGHREFLRNAIGAATVSDAALLVVDAAAGAAEQTRRHALLLNLVGLRQVAVVVTKMDKVDFSADIFERVVDDVRVYLAALGVTANAIVPVAARDGDNVAAASARMPWYDGPTVRDALAATAPRPPRHTLPLRLPVQDVYKRGDKRLVVGRLASGALAAGDAVLLSPSNQTTTVAGFEAWGAAAPRRAVAGDSVALTLSDALFVERGDIVSHPTDPPVETNVFRARLFWTARTPLAAGGRYTMKLATRSARVEVQSLDGVVDSDDLSLRPAEALQRDQVGDVVLRSPAILALDAFEDIAATGRIVLLEGSTVVGGGLINMEGYPDQRGVVTVRATNLGTETSDITVDMRARQGGHAGGVIWFTGLSGAGKSTLAAALEARLFRNGYRVYVLDGDNMRHGLNADLGFAPEDRAENIRRIGEVAALFADAGVLVITAFIAPYRSDRDRARAAAGDAFHEIYVRAPLEECERRDPKGLYRRARAGEIAEFTGISAPYEEPPAPDFLVDTRADSVEDCVRHLLDYVHRKFPLKQ